jgi:hypothetical protein
VVVAESAAKEALRLASASSDVAVHAQAIWQAVRVLCACRKYEEAFALTVNPPNVVQSDRADTFVAMARARQYLAQENLQAAEAVLPSASASEDLDVEGMLTMIFECVLLNKCCRSFGLSRITSRCVD